MVDDKSLAWTMGVAWHIRRLVSDLGFMLNRLGCMIKANPSHAARGKSESTGGKLAPAQAGAIHDDRFATEQD